MRPYYGQASQTVESEIPKLPEIPKLKEQEKERRGASVPCPWGPGAGGAGARLGSLGARAGAGSSLSGGFLGLERMALVLSRAFGGSGTFLGALFASKAGSAILAAGALSWIAVAVLSTLTHEVPSNAGPAAPIFLPPSSMKPSGIVIDAPKDRSLSYVRMANAGELSFEEAPLVAPKDPIRERPQAAESQAASKTQVQLPNIEDLVKKGLSQEALTKKLPDGKPFRLGAKLNGNTLESRNFELKKTFASVGTDGGIKLASFPTRSFRSVDSPARRTSTVRASRALGQLKYANSKSQQAYKAKDISSAKQIAIDAFEQAQDAATEEVALGATSSDDVVLPVNTAEGAYDVPEVGESTNVTPYQDQVDSAKESGDNAGAYKAIAVALLIAGAALIATGSQLLGNPTTAPIGTALIAAGTTLLTLGALFLALGLSATEQAADLGSSIGSDYGQVEQGSTVSDCADQSYATGTSIDEVC